MVFGPRGAHQLSAVTDSVCVERADSWYEYMCLSGKGMLVANTPWSGHYKVPDAVWLVRT